MTANLVFVYDGREGSSAIVSSLSRHSEVVVPIMEKMDRRNIIIDFGKDACLEIHKGLNNLLRGEDYSNKLFSFDSDSEVGSNTIFKWRPFGDIDKVSRVFFNTNTKVVCLARNDVINFSLSKYFNNRVIGKGGGNNHPQFLVNRMGEKERGEYLKSIRGKEFYIVIDDFLEDMRGYLNAKAQLFKKIDIMRGRGVEVEIFFYEDFLEDKKGFLSNILNVIDLEFEHKIMESDFEKVNRTDMRKQVKNMGEVERDSRVISLVGEYTRLLDSYFKKS